MKKILIITSILFMANIASAYDDFETAISYNNQGKNILSSYSFIGKIAEVEKGSILIGMENNKFRIKDKLQSDSSAFMAYYSRRQKEVFYKFGFGLMHGNYNVESNKSSDKATVLFYEIGNKFKSYKFNISPKFSYKRTKYQKLAILSSSTNIGLNVSKKINDKFTAGFYFGFRKNRNDLKLETKDFSYTDSINIVSPYAKVFFDKNKYVKISYEQYKKNDIISKAGNLVLGFNF